MHVLIRGGVAQQLRLVSGLLLFVFVLTHFFNHALGLISLDAMLEMQAWRTSITRSIPGSLILLTAFLTHIGLALWKISRRSTLRMPIWEAAQIISGLLIPYFLIQHVVFNRGASLFAGTKDTYAYELANLWPGFAVDQALLLLVVWIHAVIGLHYWLRLDPRYTRIMPLLIVFATALPLLALMGFVAAGRELAHQLSEPGAREALMQTLAAPSPATAGWLYGWKSAIQWIFYTLTALALAFPLLAMTLRTISARIGISYIAGPAIMAFPGPSLLEISRINGIPHASACGGRARCTTCRVHLGTGFRDLPPPERAEKNTLESVNAPPGVRLACQIKPSNDLVVRRVVLPQISTVNRNPMRSFADDQGHEGFAAILFFDLRNFTAISEQRMPYDTVFLLNSLFSTISAEMERHGGRIDKYMGDGMMVVFDGGGSLSEACRNAVAAAVATDLAMETYNGCYGGEIGVPLRCAMGLHAGLLVKGRIGGSTAAQLTVIGPAVNAASRLETLAKEREAQLVVSREVLEEAGSNVDALDQDTVWVRGVTAPLDVVIVARARDLVALG